MKQKLIILIVILVIPFQLISSDISDTILRNSVKVEDPDKAAALLFNSQKNDFDTEVKLNFNDTLVQKKNFDIGEEIHFKVKYGFIKVGSAVFKINKALPMFNRKTFMITSEAKTASFFDAFYRVRDKIISYVDASFMFSWKYIKIQREGSKKINEVINYDYNLNKATRYKSKFKKHKINHSKKEIPITSFVYDPFSALYYLRTFDFKVGEIIKIPVSSSDDIYDLKIKVIKKERIKTEIGKIECYKVEPLLLKDGIFIHKGDMTIWFTADKRKIPVKMESDVPFGSIKAYIEKYVEK